MALIESEAFVGTKKWSEGAMWKGGVAPGIKDEAVLTAGAGNVEVTLATKAKSLDCAAYKATLTLNEKTLALAAELEGAGLALRLGTEMGTTSVGVGQIEIQTTKVSKPEITTNGVGTGRACPIVVKSLGGTIKLVDALIINTGRLEILRCADFLSENNTIEVPALTAPGELATTIHLGKSVVSTGSAGTVTFGEGVTLTANEATIETGSLEAAKNHTFGTVVAKGKLTIIPLGTSPRSINIGTLKLDNGGNASEAERTLALSSATGSTIVVTTITTNASSEAKRVVIKSTTAGTAAHLKKAAGVVELDYIEVKDNTAEGEIPFKALSHSVLGTGNTNWELVSGAVAVAGTAKIKFKTASEVAVALSVTGTTKVKVKTTSLVSQSLAVAGSTRIRLRDAGAVTMTVSVAGVTKIRFRTKGAVTSTGAQKSVYVVLTVPLFEEEED